MRDSTKKNIFIRSIVIGYFLLLKLTSDLDYIQIAIVILSGRIIYISNKSDKTSIKYIGSSIGLITTIGLLILGYFPLFNNTPQTNINTHLQARQIITQSKDSKSTLTIEQDGFIKKQEITNTSKEIFLKESQKTIITFSNKTKQTTANISIQYPDQTTIYIYPNTSFSIELSGSMQIIEKIYGNIEYILGNKPQIIINNATKKNISDFVAKGLWEDYKEKERQSMIQQAGGIIMENENIRKISHYLLIMGQFIWPNHYGPYLENEKKYIQYFNWKETETPKYQTDEKEITDEMINNLEVGQKKTMFLKYLDKNE